MKRCPKCDSRFSDSDLFCELDGRTLIPDDAESIPDVLEPPEDSASQVVDPAVVLGSGAYQVSSRARRRQNLVILAVLGIAGVSIGMLVFVVYLRLTREPAVHNSNASIANGAITQQPITYVPVRPSPSVSASPTPEPSPSPSVTPSPVVQTEPVAAALSSSPVSTGGDKKAGRQVTIRLNNGTTVEADEAWETGEGIWYRSGGVVTLLGRDQVKAIERATEKASPPVASPSATP